MLRNIAFSAEYAASVEQKQIAEQQAQQAKFVIESKKNEAQQAREVAKGLADAAVTKAQGEADARLIQAEAEAKALADDRRSVESQPGPADLSIHYQVIAKRPGDAGAE